MKTDLKIKSDPIVVEDYLNLAKKISLTYVCPGEPVLDSEAYAEALIALIEAVDSYDPDVSKFSTWATRRIKQHLVDWYRKSSRGNNRLSVERLNGHDVIDEKAVKLPIGILERILERHPDDDRLFQKKKQVLVDRFLNGKSVKDIADELGVTIRRVRQMQDHAISRLNSRFRHELDPD